MEIPSHRKTLLMMQNLHNNYLYSANSGILFTMQRGWNSEIEDVKKPEMSSLGGDPVNISNLLFGAKKSVSIAD